uniref:Putative secreted protein n=1 Tax=Ixodes scapularis TaxID=6945 RepID=A0A4D5RE12_IXOSC
MTPLASAKRSTRPTTMELAWLCVADTASSSVPWNKQRRCIGPSPKACTWLRCWHLRRLSFRTTCNAAGQLTRHLQLRCLRTFTS